MSAPSGNPMNPALAPRPRDVFLHLRHGPSPVVHRNATFTSESGGMYNVGIVGESDVLHRYPMVNIHKVVEVAPPEDQP